MAREEAVKIVDPLLTQIAEHPLPALGVAAEQLAVRGYHEESVLFQLLEEAEKIIQYVDELRNVSRALIGTICDRPTRHFALEPEGRCTLRLGRMETNLYFDATIENVRPLVTMLGRLDCQELDGETWLELQHRLSVAVTPDALRILNVEHSDLFPRGRLHRYYQEERDNVVLYPRRAEARFALSGVLDPLQPIPAYRSADLDLWEQGLPESQTGAIVRSVTRMLLRERERPPQPSEMMTLYQLWERFLPYGIWCERATAALSSARNEGRLLS